MSKARKPSAEKTETLASYMQRLDALWGDAEPVAHDLIGSGDPDQQRQGQRLLNYWEAWRELTIQSGLTELTEDPRAELNGESSLTPITPAP